MVALLEALGKFGTLAADGVHANEEQKARIRAEAEANWHTYKQAMEGYWAGIAADDAEMAALARPLPPPASVPPVAVQPAPPVPAPAPQPAPAAPPAVPAVSPEPSGVE